MYINVVTKRKINSMAEIAKYYKFMNPLKLKIKNAIDISIGHLRFIFRYYPVEQRNEILNHLDKSKAFIIVPMDYKAKSLEEWIIELSKYTKYDTVSVPLIALSKASCQESLKYRIEVMREEMLKEANAMAVADKGLEDYIKEVSQDMNLTTNKYMRYNIKKSEFAKEKR
jgi:hypothetical protein